jgi:HlyD family secretion protein
VKKLLTVLVLAGLCLAGLAWWLNTRHERAGQNEEYMLGSVEYGPLTDVISATGVVQPIDVFAIGSEVPGKVVAVLADFNQSVEEGDVLVRLDDRVARDRVTQAVLGVDLARAGLHQAQAAYDNAARALERERKRSPEVRQQADIDLVQGHLRTAQATLEAAQVRVREAEEGRRQAEFSLSQTEVRAPVLAPTADSPSTVHSVRAGVGSLAPEGTTPQQKRSFVVLDRKVSVGQLIGPPASAHLFTLAGDLEHVQVVAQVVEGDVAKVTPEQRARFTVSGNGDTEPAFEGKVEDVRLTPSSEHGAVYYKVVIEARNERAGGSWKLRPGQTASVEIVRRSHDPTWKMPAAALNFQPEDSVLSDEARAKVQHWQQRADESLWRATWVVGSDHKPWPVFVRVGGQNSRGQEGIQDSQFSEVLEWDPEVASPQVSNPATWPRPITGMPSARKVSWFNPPQLKL